jgi:hypothetical protein
MTEILHAIATRILNADGAVLVLLALSVLPLSLYLLTHCVEFIVGSIARIFKRG